MALPQSASQFQSLCHRRRGQGILAQWKISRAQCRSARRLEFCARPALAGAAAVRFLRAELVHVLLRLARARRVRIETGLPRAAKNKPNHHRANSLGFKRSEFNAKKPGSKGAMPEKSKYFH